MKILLLADQPCKAFWDYFERSKLEGIDLIISCGDLPPAYLSFLVTMVPVPVYYVHGNHDDRYAQKPPDGCESIDGRIINYKGVRILGLGGSMRYHPDGVHMYTEREMCKRIRKLRFKIWLKGGVDLLITHAPAKDWNDGCDLPHQGFCCFRKLIDRYRPKYFVHGHMHLNYGRYPRFSKIGDTTVVNAFERCIIEI